MRGRAGSPTGNAGQSWTQPGWGLSVDPYHTGLINSENGWIDFRNGGKDAPNHPNSSMLPSNQNVNHYAYYVDQSGRVGPVAHARFRDHLVQCTEDIPTNGPRLD
ncbi:hypothetical protein ABZ442_01220 [Streptomyces triculaminicus]|uniref:hypothetical protein n=1 Tax=Streptomyces triculaminicus TaxID=2816232 RepID=UPI003404E20E